MDADILTHVLLGAAAVAFVVGVGRLIAAVWRDPRHLIEDDPFEREE